MNLTITWQPGKHLPVFVKGGAMGLVQGLPVYAAGVTYPWRETEQAWYYHREHNNWFPVEPSMPLGRAYTSGVTLEDGLIVVGGRKSHAGTRESLADVWWLRRADDRFTWTPLPAMHTPRAVACLGVTGRRILAFGGGEWERSQGGAFATPHLPDYEVLDLNEARPGWQAMGGLPFEPRAGAACASIGHAAYVFGGYTCWTHDNQRHIRILDDAWRYDFGADRWTALARLPIKWSGGCAAALDERHILLMAGVSRFVQDGQELPYTVGHTRDPGTGRQREVGGYSDLVLLYDTATNTYRILPDRLPVGVNDARCVVDGTGTIWVAGGETVDPALSNCTELVMIGTVTESQEVDLLSEEDTEAPEKK